MPERGRINVSEVKTQKQGGDDVKIMGSNISMIRGDSETITVSLIGSSNVVVPFVTGDTVYLTIKINDCTATKLLQKVITDFPEGKAVIEIKPEDTKSLTFGDYVYDIQLTTALGVVTTIVTPSKFSIKGEITYE